MNIRWSELIAALMVAAWLGLFTMSCSVPAPPPELESRSSTETSDEEEVPLNQPGSALEQQAEQGDLAPPAHEVNPGVHHN
ncbi:MAG: hypothetical protein K9M82_12620 [Deltaproteobacteria bacterium]|nr:hypothetical protein [Deltaproteobacteria bacterium]